MRDWRLARALVPHERMVVEAVLYPLVSGDFRGNTGKISRKRRKNGLHNQFKPVISGLSGLSIRCQEQGNWVFVSANGLEISGKIAAQFSRATSGGNVRFTPKSGHSFPSAQCPLCANSGHSPLQLLHRFKRNGAPRKGAPFALNTRRELFTLASCDGAWRRRPPSPRQTGTG